MAAAGRVERAMAVTAADVVRWYGWFVAILLVAAAVVVASRSSSAAGEGKRRQIHAK